ncbi:Aromatic-ring-hydroxylating dioxygenase, alpha subunit [Cynara cardunculus var. scolymus]|uniref:Choline monooxygenase, chloroplastic n=1 Tax=Cynara cardunculus var. scolymus TaxID=59895 RepID=A0A103YMJ6_CYNCS|nr:Aromatic-ring-hydroxylating dioxygenase, alpha subunit [Cynara cardunculus var. scolymus]
MATMMMMMKPIGFQFSDLKKLRNPYPNSPLIRRSHEPNHGLLQMSQDLDRSLVHEFNPSIPIQEALTPPSSWYTCASFLSLELNQVFFKGWQAVGCTHQIQEANSFFTGRLGNVEYVVCRDENGELRAFHNVCRHHASLLAYGSGKGSCFVCPYHGWTYGLDGRLLKATRITGIKNFNVKEFGLVPVRVAIWGPFILLNLERKGFDQQNCDDNVGMEWLGSTSEILSTNGVDTSLSYLRRREYTIECNWKVWFLNSISHLMVVIMSLSHIKILHQVLSSTPIPPPYAPYYLNLRLPYLHFVYGPWMDTNLVLPLGPRRCKVIFDYFLDASLKDDEAFVAKSLEDSEQVQMEDIMLCESVQRGLESPAYDNGRYAPMVEKAMHHFHSLLHQHLIK